MLTVYAGFDGKNPSPTIPKKGGQSDAYPLILR